MIRNLLLLLGLLISIRSFSLKDSVSTNRIEINCAFSENIYTSFKRNINYYAIGNLSSSLIYSGHVNYTFMNALGYNIQLNHRFIKKNYSILAGISFNYLPQRVDYYNSSYVNSKNSSLKTSNWDFYEFGVDFYLSKKFHSIEFMMGSFLTFYGPNYLIYTFNDNTTYRFPISYGGAQFYLSEKIIYTFKNNKYCQINLGIDFKPFALLDADRRRYYNLLINGGFSINI